MSESQAAAIGATGRPRVMVVQEDRGYRQVVRRALLEVDFEVETASDAYVAMDRFGQFKPHLVLMDIALTRGDGLELARRLRRRPGGAAVGIIILTSRDSLGDKLQGFEAGADDYIVKPVALAEVVARAKAQLRHVWTSDPEVLRFADVTLDVGKQLATRGDRRSSLTTTEFHLLELFLRHPLQVLSRRTIGEQLWGVDFEAESNVIDVYVKRLRRKLEGIANPPLIHTVRGSGYVLRAPEEPEPSEVAG